MVDKFLPFNGFAAVTVTREICKNTVAIDQHIERSSASGSRHEKNVCSQGNSLKRISFLSADSVSVCVHKKGTSNKHTLLPYIFTIESR